jgi:valyl-tRNA synthetase
MNVESSEVEDINRYELDMSSNRIVQTKEHLEKVSKYIEKFQFNLGSESIREFFWHQYCDIWIEEIKKEIQEGERIPKLAELVYILKENLKIMHPFIPFVTEAVWQELVNIELANGVLMSKQLD